MNPGTVCSPNLEDEAEVEAEDEDEVIPADARVSSGDVM